MFFNETLCESYDVLCIMNYRACAAPILLRWCIHPGKTAGQRENTEQFFCSVRGMFAGGQSVNRDWTSWTFASPSLSQVSTHDFIKM